VVVALCVGEIGLLLTPPQAQALPAFARKYNVNCAVCHTRPPRLNTFGERFLENGYQMPGTEDGGVIGKRKLGDLTLDDVSNYVAFRLTGNAVRHFNFARKSSGPGIEGNPEDKTEFGFPDSFFFFTGGTVTQNIAFYVNMQYDFENETFGNRRALVSFNNLGYHDLAHIRVGKIDPSAYFSYPTHRPHLHPVRGSGTNLGGFQPATLNRIPLVPTAFGAKFFGLFERGGKAIAPFRPSLFNSPDEIGIDIHGRPFGDWFLYQVGILNGANESFGDSNNPKDWYVMTRFDYTDSDLFSANISGFAYFGNNNAKVAFNQADVNWNRYGIAANIRYKMVDIYGAYTIDRVTNLPQQFEANFDATATGLIVETDVLVTDKLLLSVRYDHLDAGGVLAKRKSNSILGMQAKYYLRSNISFYIRDDVNLRKSEGGVSGARNFRNAFLVGADFVF
jgi:hypothetical protein